jgi:hypothetical protein
MLSVRGNGIQWFVAFVLVLLSGSVMQHAFAARSAAQVPKSSPETCFAAKVSPAATVIQRGNTFPGSNS